MGCRSSPGPTDRRTSTAPRTGRSDGWVSTAKAEQLLTDAAAPNLTGIPFTTTCAGGSKVVVGGPVTTFECVLSENANPSNGERHTATITSADGGIRFE